MNFIIAYLLEVTFMSGIFWLGYQLIRKSTTPTFKRFYLIGWLVFSTLFPVISVPTQQSAGIQLTDHAGSIPDRQMDTQSKPDVGSLEIGSTQAIGSVNELEEDRSNGFDLNLEVAIIAVYLVVTSFFLLRLFLGVFQILRLRRQSSVLFHDNFKYYSVDSDEFKGASFFKWIFIDRNINDFGVIMRHEKAHARLWHSLDILLINVYCGVLWANPFSWILKKYVSLNTELEADWSLTRGTDYRYYANTLLELSSRKGDVSLMNYFSAFNLKSRIMAMKNKPKHRNWVTAISLLVTSMCFWLFSCDYEQASDVMMAEKLQSVKTITTRFTSHQNDTQQKTGKIVAIATFLPDGTLEEFVEQTTYPYDREFEVKKYFWDAPEKTGLPYIMDGLTTGDAEKTFLYGNDWPIAYAKFLKKRSLSEGDFPWREIVNVDNDALPNEIETIREKSNKGMFVDFGMPDVTEYFNYEDGKVISVEAANFYNEVDDSDERQKQLRGVVEVNMTKEQKNRIQKLREQSGKKFVTSEYTYEGNKMTSVKSKDYERKYFYENNLLVRSEYYKSGTLLNSRVHYYKGGLKDRTEIFNRYNEPEYTITYEYEFW